MNLKGVDKQTWVRIIVLFLSLANLVSTSLFNVQLLPFSDEQLYTGVSSVVVVVTSVWAGWKNNSLTAEAQLADERLKRLKK